MSEEIKRPSMLTVEQTAEEIQLKRGTVYVLIQNGTIPAIKIGRNVRVRRTDLEAFCNANRTFSRKESIA